MENKGKLILWIGYNVPLSPFWWKFNTNLTILDCFMGIKRNRCNLTFRNLNTLLSAPLISFKSPCVIEGLSLLDALYIELTVVASFLYILNLFEFLFMIRSQNSFVLFCSVFNVHLILGCIVFICWCNQITFVKVSE